MKNKQSLKPYITGSLLAHVFVVGVFVVKATFFPSEDIVLGSALKVDMVGLPELRRKRPPQKAPVEKKVKLPKAEAKVEPKTETKKEAKKEVKKEAKKESENVKSKQDRALRQLKIKKALAQIKKDQQQSKQVESEQAEAKKASDAPVKGNIISDGGSLSGLDRLEYDEYYEKLESHMKSYWELPQWLAGGGLHAQVSVKIGFDGYVIEKVVHQSSGNSVFDSKALESVQKAMPLPSPPPRLRNLLVRQGLIFSFP